jgi:diguanylate cyclase (GGDEF)-like protein
MLIVDTLGRFDGLAESFYPIFNRVGNFVVFALQPIIPATWVMYAHLNIFQDEERTLKLRKPLLLIVIFNFILVILTQFTGWFYVIDAENIYQRGPFYLISVLFAISLVIVAFIMILMNKDKVEERHYNSLLFFALPPVISIFLQIHIYGISFMLNAIVISLLIILLNIQNQSMYTDYLTGIYNRKWLDYAINQRINRSNAKQSFAAILIDLDEFKTINDTYGHDVGDKVLQSLTQVFKSCLGSESLLARYGGDEFYIILNTGNKDILQRTIEQLRNCMKDYNETNARGFKLSISVGSIVYDPQSNWSVADFQKKVDELLYLNKRNKKINKE